MKILKAFCLAFTTYSRIPMVCVRPDKDSMRYLLCFLPVIGAAAGALFMLWFYLCAALNISRVCFAAVAAVLPVLVTGGIHADGYIDTNDALSCYGEKQKMLQILSDPHVGAFGIIAAIVYYILYFGFLNEMSAYSAAAVTGLGFVLSRAICSFEIAFLKPAKQSGMLYELKSASSKKATAFMSVIFIIVCVAATAFVNVYIGALVVLCQAALVIYHKCRVVNRIGGITGDTCGHFIMMSELLTVMTVVIGGRLVNFMPALF